MAKKTIEQIDICGLSLSAVIEKVNAVFGKNTLALASSAKGLTIRKLSTGVYALDFCLGGGVPENRITELFGKYSALKSTICNRVIANFQKRYPKGQAFYEDGEQSFDPTYAEHCGVDCDRLGIINSDCGEQAIDVISALIRNNVHVLVIIDSIASLIPLDELECSAEQQFQGLHPRLIGKLMRILSKGMKRNMYDATAATTTVIATNQLREKTGIVYGNPEFTPGGRAKDHYCSVRIKFTSNKSDSLMEKVVHHGIERERRVGQVVNFEINKNKVGHSQFEEGTFTYFIRAYKDHAPYTIDNEEILFRYGVYYGLILRLVGKKKPVYCFDGMQYAEPAFKNRLITSVKQFKLFRMIMREMLEEDSAGLVSSADDTERKPVKIVFNK